MDSHHLSRTLEGIWITDPMAPGDEIRTDLRREAGIELENIGTEPARILIVFNSGVYETVDVSQWIAGQPADVLAVNFGTPAATFAAFPKRDVFISGNE